MRHLGGLSRFIVLAIVANILISSSPIKPVKAFKVGEELTYAVKYMGVRAGEGVLRVKGLEKYQKKPVYVIEAQGYQNPSFTLYKINAFLKTYLDSKYLFSRRYEENIKSSKETKNIEVVFDQTKHTTTRNGKTRSIPKRALDPLAALYSIRSQGVKIGRASKIHVTNGKKTYEVILAVLGQEKIKTPAGTFEAYRIRPFIKKMSDNSRKDIEINVWMSVDKGHIPLRIAYELPVGEVEIVLEKAKGI
ncbi:DUF3108 domain-containing protein [Elusimicrobiota bacterium]